jgi:hypothetical protein
MSALVGLAVMLAACNLQQKVEITPVPTPNIPAVQFRFPPNNTTIIEGAELDVEILATDGGIGVAQVEFKVDDQIQQVGRPQISQAVPAFTVKMNWTAQGVGRHPLTATAYRPDGTPSDTATIIIEVLPRPAATP